VRACKPRPPNPIAISGWPRNTRALTIRREMRDAARILHRLFGRDGGLRFGDRFHLAGASIPPSIPIRSARAGWKRSAPACRGATSKSPRRVTIPTTWRPRPGTCRKQTLLPQGAGPRAAHGGARRLYLRRARPLPQRRRESGRLSRRSFANSARKPLPPHSGVTYAAVIPPSTRKVAPVMKEDSAEAR